jgi:hypothetical protein
MRHFVALACALAAVLPAGVASVEAASLPRFSAGSASMVETVGSRSYYRPRQKDCTPTNGPFGYYGNLWCQPSESSYLRNLGSQWPMPTPPSLRYPKPSQYGSTDW